MALTRFEMKFQLRLVVALFTVILVVVLASSFWLVDRLRADLRQDMAQELSRYVKTGKRLVEGDQRLLNESSFDGFCDELSLTLEARFTVIRGDGAVLGDSEIPAATLPSIESHAERPEIRHALKDGFGVSSRLSRTVKRELVYVAIPVSFGGQKYILRGAKDTDDVEALIGALSQPVYIAVLIALGLALVLSVFVSRVLSRDLENIGRKLWNVRAPAEVGAHGALPRNEFRFIERSIDSMAKELDEAVADLVRERDRLSEVLEAMHAAVVVSDKDSRVALANASARRMFNRGNAMDGRRMSEVVRVPEVQDCLRTDIGTQPETFEFELGEPTPMDCMAHVSCPPSSGGAILVVHDVTELRRLEKVRRELVANVSHELRTPVSVIRANTETLLDGAFGDPSAAGFFLGAIDRSSKRLTAILRDLLDLARIESGTYKLEMVEVDFHRLCEALVMAFSKAAKETGLELRSSIEPGTRVFADEGALEQIMTNYVENAVKYTPGGGQVILAATTLEGFFRAEVRDTGPGISAEYRERVFERFFRVDQGRSREVGGTGLGLSIVKNLAAQMDGVVGVDGGEASGTVFYVELPLTSSDA